MNSKHLWLIGAVVVLYLLYSNGSLATLTGTPKTTV